MNMASRRDRFIHRLLEILPGLVSWNLILLPWWGIFVFPVFVAYFVLFFDVFWLYKSVMLALAATVAHLRIEAARHFNWGGELQKFGKDSQKVLHIIILATYKEPLHILERTFNSIAAQDFNKEQIAVVLAMEAREDEKEREKKVKELKTKFGKKLGHFFVTVHKLAAGEIAGKSSNERYAAIWAKKKFVQELGYNQDYIVVTSSDADHSFSPQHFSYLTFKFLDDPHRYFKFWQPAIVFYNNFWRLPAITRVVNTLMSLWNTGLLARTDRLINQQNYALSLRLLSEAGYWDPNIIPEDYHIFFKAFFKKQGRVEVEPIYLPVWADAAQSETLWGTLKNQYLQLQRWAWGVSDDPYVIKSYFTVRNVSFWNKTIRVLRLVEDHFLWPVNWFIVTLGLTVPSIINPDFSRTAVGHTLPGLSAAILSITLIFLVVLLVIDARQRPARPKEFPVWRAFTLPIEFILMPVAGFFFSALPGLDAHTRLMLGKYLQYRVTEKV